MKARILLTAVFAAVVLTLAVSFAWSDSSDQEHSASLQAVMAQIRRQLGLGPNDSVEPSRVPDNLLERLGDAVMDVMVPNEQEHQWMDQMMGGEGSASLAAAHRWMGYRYLTGGYAGEVGGSYGGMMGYGMMGGAYPGSWGMMGDPELAYNSIPYDSPEQVVKHRYAEGQITRSQYQQMMKDLQTSSR